MPNHRINVVFEYDRVYPIHDSRESFDAAKAILASVSGQLPRMLDGLECDFSFAILPPRRENDPELPPLIISLTVSGSSDDPEDEIGDEVNLLVTVADAGAEELPPILSEMGVLLALIGAATGRTPRRLTVIVVRLSWTFRLALDRLPLVAGRGVDALLGAQWGDVSPDFVSTPKPACAAVV